MLTITLFYIIRVYGLGTLPTHRDKEYCAIVGCMLHAAYLTGDSLYLIQNTILYLFCCCCFLPVQQQELIYILNFKYFRKIIFTGNVEVNHLKLD